MREYKNKNEKGENEKIWCEKFKEYVNIEEGCKHFQGFCPYRDRCLIFLQSKLKDF